MRWIAKTTTLSIRPYQKQDRAGLMKIAADTAFFGEPIEKYMEDRRIFLDSFYAYYTDYEPEHCWVALDDQLVVGFLTGCANTTRQQQINRRNIMPRVYWRFLTMQYKPGPKAWNYFRRLARAQRAHQFAEADLNLYPAHLHINVDTAYRGHGIGLRLMQSFLDQLIYEQIPGVHLGTSSENEGACRLYTQLGFQLLDARNTSLWQDIIDHPVENRTYGLLLPAPPEQIF